MQKLSAHHQIQVLVCFLLKSKTWLAPVSIVLDGGLEKSALLGLPHFEATIANVEGMQRSKHPELCLQGLIFSTENINTP